MAVCLVVVAGLHAGQATGSISGVITDPDGGLMPEATVTAANETTTRTIVTNSTGRFRLDDLPVGTYRLTARLSRGFTTASTDNLVVVAGRDTTWNASLTYSNLGMQSLEPPRGRDPLRPDLANRLYGAVVAHVLGRRPVARIVVDSVSLIPIRLEDEDWAGRFDGIPRDLRRRVESDDSQWPVRHNLDVFPPTVVAAQREDIAGVFADRDSLDAFRRRFGPDSYLALSRAFVSDDEQHAVVFFVHGCGNPCGEGTVLWLQRSADSAVWTVRNTIGLWVS